MTPGAESMNKACEIFFMDRVPATDSIFNYAAELHRNFFKLFSVVFFNSSIVGKFSTLPLRKTEPDTRSGLSPQRIPRLLPFLDESEPNTFFRITLQHCNSPTEAIINDVDNCRFSGLRLACNDIQPGRVQGNLSDLSRMDIQYDFSNDETQGRTPQPESTDASEPDLANHFAKNLVAATTSFMSLDTVPNNAGVKCPFFGPATRVTVRELNHLLVNCELQAIAQ